VLVEGEEQEFCVQSSIMATKALLVIFTLCGFAGMNTTVDNIVEFVHLAILRVLIHTDANPFAFPYVMYAQGFTW